MCPADPAMTEVTRGNLMRANMSAQTKKCRTCKAEKPCDGFADHNGSGDGKRLDCRECLLTGRRNPVIESPEQRAKRKVRQSRRKWRRSHRKAIAKWSERYPLASTATKIVQQAIRQGKLKKSKRCQALGCTSEKNVETHHHDYAKPLEVIFLCAHHHRRGHSVGYIPVAPGLPPRLGNIPARA